jgi:hypothetical protein
MKQFDAALRIIKYYLVLFLPNLVHACYLKGTRITEIHCFFMKDRFEMLVYATKSRIYSVLLQGIKNKK